MKKVLLLDLENTIIPVWNDFYPMEVNCKKIRDFNETFQAEEVGLFSWAVWNQRDIDIWDRVKEDFEIEMDVKFTHTQSIEQYIELTRTIGGPNSMDTMDFFDFYDKERCLFQLMLHKWMDGCHVVLFDDVVVPCVVEYENSKLEIINIDKIDVD